MIAPGATNVTVTRFYAVKKRCPTLPGKAVRDSSPLMYSISQ